MNKFLLCFAIIIQFSFAQTSKSPIPPDWKPYVNNSKQEQEDSDFNWSLSRAASLGKRKQFIFYAIDRAHQTFSPYGYAAGNPLKYTDQSGDTIDVYYWNQDGDRQQFRYTPGMKYEGNKDVMKMVSYINRLHELGGDKSIVSTLDKSETNYFVGFNCAIDARGQFSTEGNKIEFNLNKYDFETVAHEFYHGYSHDQGYGASQADEVSARLYGITMDMRNGGKGPYNISEPIKIGSTANNPAGNYRSAFMNLEKQFDDIQFSNAVQNFTGGASGWQKYQDHKDWPTGPYIQPPLVKLYPLLERKMR
jgi:hypothetical protein